MSSVSNVLKKEMLKSNGTARLVKVPSHMRLTQESLKKLDREISAQIESNRVMRYRSMIEAQK